MFSHIIPGFAAPLSLMCFFLHRLEQTVSGTGPGALPLWFRLTKLANALKEVATAPENGKFYDLFFRNNFMCICYFFVTFSYFLLNLECIL